MLRCRSAILTIIFSLVLSNSVVNAQRLPNVIVLLADDLGYGETGCQGNSQIPTPFIDSIAKNGIRCTQGYVTAAYCSASRAGLLTGRYQQQFGYEVNPIGARNEEPGVGLPTTEKTLADALVDSGYVTGLIGKWHLGGTAPFHPIRRGFDEFFGFMHEGHYFVPPPYRSTTTWMRRKVLPGGGQGRWVSRDGKTIYSTHLGYTEPDYDANNPIYRGGQPVEESSYLTDAFTREAVDFIDRNSDRPFFLYLAYNAVHSPLQGADKYMAKFEHIEDIQRRIFAAMLANLDDSVGAVLQKVRDEGLERDTILFFLSDNGGPTKELTSSNAPLRGGKGTMYEGGIRVPLLVQWPGRLPGGKVYEHPVISLDIFATMVHLANTPRSSYGRLDGVNLIPYLSGDNPTPPHRKLYWRTGRKAALRLEEWKIVRNPTRQNAVEWELYHLETDAAESKDLAAARPSKLQELIKTWERTDEGYRQAALTLSPAGGAK